ncbi:DUF4097 family beta strand repeat-containing protein [Bacillus sp. REN3]|uniref:LiaG family protein n=1 Tax=Bacillus sp. REN3 TaxID=2802440 RepID=UPI001AEE04D0|nr:DUF4097 family beta strand repeat-containing protein [Bacillus sp. REN3]
MLKRIFVIFLIITGAYIGLSYLLDGYSSSKGKDSAKVSRNTEKIAIDISSTETAIIPDDRNDVYAELSGKGIVSVDRKGDEIKVTVKQKRFFGFNWSDLDRPSLAIYIPEDYVRDMEIELGSGEVKFSGASAKNPMELNELEVEIGSGSMELENLKVDHFNHESSSGDVKMESIRTGTGSFKVSSGSVKVKDYSGRLDADVSSGELEIGMEELKDRINLKVSSGYMGLDLPDDADFYLNGKMSSGDIKCQFPLENKSENKNRLSGKHGSGKHEIDADISSGNMKIY